MGIFKSGIPSSAWRALGAIAIPHVAGGINALLIRPLSDPWYQELKKPSWRPPSAAFAIVWSTLYTGMGYASYLIWKDGGGINGAARIPLTLYASQLALNWSWNPVFFYFRSLKWSLVDMSFLWCNVAACIFEFWKINKTAGILMTPYLAWLTLALSLNYCIWRDNKENQKSKAE
ncbi:translocator protein-like [Ischnura elegans]|uniref:translocator protein-like n=1 Tax=Ischnura elegans TaxID=197161 RepID=UPI001ED8B934|nr:translocator protein-like [Ischnura elegans]XP_046382546.1 translocator protein-like [Ischnura elegans]XP_046382547.1 translocator protein-like [Ischnura elegans]XP_046382548.1 translocator protein-like [Ischnura elegans]